MRACGVQVQRGSAPRPRPWLQHRDSRQGEPRMRRSPEPLPVWLLLKTGLFAIVARHTRDSRECGLAKHLVDKGDGNGSLADRRGDALDIAAPHIADREDAGSTGFEKIGPPAQRPTRRH
jgi:hypothetical protein